MTDNLHIATVSRLFGVKVEAGPGEACVKKTGTDGSYRPQASKLPGRHIISERNSALIREKKLRQSRTTFKILAMARKKGAKSSNGLSTVVTSIFVGSADLDPSLTSLFSSTVSKGDRYFVREMLTAF